MRAFSLLGLLVVLGTGPSAFSQNAAPGRQLFGSGGPVGQPQAAPRADRAERLPPRQTLPPGDATGRPRMSASADTPLMLSQTSWTYSPPPPVRQVQINDIVTIRVDELASVRAEGASESRKNSLYDAILKDWLSFNDGDLVPDPQRSGDPRVNGTLNSLYRADAALESRESLTLNIAARVVDIRPNGHLVLEAHKNIFVNENAWETSLSGVCRPQDVGPDNVVLSRDIIDLQIKKQERGRLRDGYRRGWFQRWFEELQPF